eukprot:JP446599.1.p1 GENE.JP446599.1~~JP446599.1.p1  ORF type:complete len:297 (-),score=69.55 JP446599.1:96-956(-)
MAEGAAIYVALIEWFTETLEIMLQDIFSRTELSTIHGPSNIPLSEAFALLWHNKETGDVKGRKSADELSVAMFATTIVDLMVSERLSVETVREKHWIFSSDDSYLQVINPAPTDAAGLDMVLQGIAAYTAKQKKRTLRGWLRDLAYGGNKELRPKEVTNAVLDTLVAKGVLGKEEHKRGISIFSTITYPTMDPAPRQAVVDVLRNIVLGDVTPEADPFAHILLLIVKFSGDAASMGSNFILERVFTKEERNADEFKQKMKTLCPSPSELKKQRKAADKEAAVSADK